MTTRKDQPDTFDDVEKPHPLVVESAPDGESRLVTVRLSDPWADFVRAAGRRSDPDAAPRSPAAVPLLDDMKGILQWD
jgi:hypothetical protein